MLTCQRLPHAESALWRIRQIPLERKALCGDACYPCHRCVAPGGRRVGAELQFLRIRLALVVTSFLMPMFSHKAGRGRNGGGDRALLVEVE